MNLVDFIKMANSLDEQNMPRCTTVVCLVEFVENEEHEVITKVKQMVALSNSEIKIDCFMDGCDENGYIEVKTRFKDSINGELAMVWKMLEECQKFSFLDDKPMDTETAPRNDIMIEVMILPKEVSEINPIFLELAFPVNFTLCSSGVGQVADTLNLFFNMNSCYFHENDYLELKEMEKGVGNCISLLAE